MTEDLTIEYAEFTAENNVAERHFRRKHMSWMVPYSPYHRLEYADLSVALNYMLLVLVPYFIVITVFYIIHYAERRGPMTRLIDDRDIYMREVRNAIEEALRGKSLKAGADLLKNQKQ